MTTLPDPDSETETDTDTETQTLDSTTSTPETDWTLSRRRVLQAAGTAGVAALAGPASAAGGHTLDLSLWQTARMRDAAAVARDDPAYAQMQAKQYVEPYAKQLIAKADYFDDVRVRMRTPAIALDTAAEYDNPEASIAIRLLGFNGRLQSEYEPSAHGNLLLDTPTGAPILGQAFRDPADSMAGKMTDAGVLDYATRLLKLPPDHTAVSPGDYQMLINNEEGMNAGMEVGMAAAHELGHNLKLRHNQGAPDVVDDVVPAATVMTGIYLLFYGGLQDHPNADVPEANACGQEWPSVDVDIGPYGSITGINDDIGVLPTTASMCEQRAFLTDARDLARKGAAGYRASVGTGPTRQNSALGDIEDVTVTTELPQVLADMWS